MMRSLALLLICLALPSVAATLDELAAADKLRVRSWLEPDSDIALGQEVTLNIEVSTPRWFAGGTRITPPEVDGLVILRRNEFAFNISRREAGATWVAQRWELELYPQRAGEFRLPAMVLGLAVNDADSGIVRGELRTSPLEFEVVLPAAMRGDDRWLATPSLVLRQSFDRALEALAPGDAFTRTLEIEATDIPSMMLPIPEFVTPAGLDAYPDIPELVDRSNRGEATAIRRQSITYIVVEAGQYRLPSLSLAWWNTGTQRREIAELPGVAIDAGAGAAPVPRIAAPAWTWPALAGVAVILVLFLLYARRRTREQDPMKLARQAIRRGEAKHATRALYAWLNQHCDMPGWLSLRESAASVDAAEAAETLLNSSYGGGESTPLQARTLLQKLARQKRRKQDPPALCLNPTQPRK